MVKGSRADYPSIADFGFLGFFFLLTGVLGFFKQLDSEDTKAQKKDYISFAVVLCILFSGFEISLHKVMDFAYALMTGWTLFLSCQLLRLPYYKDLLRGVFAVCLINIIMISSKGFWADATLVLRSGMPFAISLLMYGIYKNNGDEA
jgi:hypothetical protein